MTEPVDLVKVTPHPPFQPMSSKLVCPHLKNNGWVLTRNTRLSPHGLPVCSPTLLPLFGQSQVGKAKSWLAPQPVEA